MLAKGGIFLIYLPRTKKEWGRSARQNGTCMAESHDTITASFIMRAVVQLTGKASVKVGGRVTGSIEHGLVVLLGVHKQDTAKDARYLADKIAHLRIFPDANGQMNKSVLDVGGGALVVSQFTLLGDCRKGRRPGYSSAAPPERAKELYELFITELVEFGIGVATGEFQAMMDVSLVNTGPVTLLVDSTKLF